MNRTVVRFGALAAAATLTLSACGRDDGGDEDDAQSNGDGDVATDIGVTSDPCPDAVNEDNGCIYLGIISDLTGPFAPIGVPLTEGGKAFWAKVNADGGIGGYDIDVTSNIKDNQYNPDVHAQGYNEIKGDILAMAQSLGTVATESMLRDPDAEELVVIPATLGSNWLFEDRVLEIGTSYCAEAMNIVDHAVDELGADNIVAVHFEGDYGGDAAKGAEAVAEARDVEFTSISMGPGGDPAPVVAQIMRAQPDVVVVATAPTELAQIVGGAAQAGFQGQFIGSTPTWNAALLDSPAAPALEALYTWANVSPGWDADTPGHEEMRAAAEEAGQDPNEYFVLGYAGSYVMRAALEAAVESGDLTRAGLLEAATGLDGVDTQGLLPEGTGNYVGEPNDIALRTTYLLKPDKSAGTGAVLSVDGFTGPTTEGYEFEQACYLQ